MGRAVGCAVCTQQGKLSRDWQRNGVRMTRANKSSCGRVVDISIFMQIMRNHFWPLNQNKVLNKQTKPMQNPRSGRTNFQLTGKAHSHNVSLCHVARARRSCPGQSKHFFNLNANCRRYSAVSFQFSISGTVSVVFSSAFP